MSTLAQSLKQGTMVSFEEVIFGHYPQSYYLWPEKKEDRYADDSRGAILL